MSSGLAPYQRCHGADPGQFSRRAAARCLTREKRYHLKRRELVKRFLSSVSLLILEEAHESSGSNFYDIARLCINADYRLALTATPFMKDSTEANMRLMAVAGRIEIKVTENI